MVELLVLGEREKTPQKCFYHDQYNLKIWY